MDHITVSTTVHAPLEKAWDYFTQPAHIVQWNAASDDWHTTKAENDLRAGGTFSSRMEARDGSAGFDFGGTYTDVIPHSVIAYVMADGRTVRVTFEPHESGIIVTETFDPETENPAEFQQAGWQTILDNFKKHAEEN